MIFFINKKFIIHIIKSSQQPYINHKCLIVESILNPTTYLILNAAKMSMFYNVFLYNSTI